MDVISQIEDLEIYIRGLKKSEKTTGFVPTMGALHQGHLSLMERCVKENEHSLASIFVNPLQFNNPDDLKTYPRDLDNDLMILEKAGCNMVFTPDHESFYREKPQISFDFGNLGRVLEGEFRPGHFNGVAIVVSRLLHHTSPDRAYFGLKDLQQYLIVRRMCLDLGIKTEIVGCDIIREKDGLAMSSRNRKLSAEDRQKATGISAALFFMEEACRKNRHFREARQSLSSKNVLAVDLKIEYLELVRLPEFELDPPLIPGYDYAICIAAHLGNVRLIDNIQFRL